jgi:hypothetical protein
MEAQATIAVDAYPYEPQHGKKDRLAPI